MFDEIAELFASLRLEVHKEDFEQANELVEMVHHGLEALAVFEDVKWVKELFESTEEAAISVKHMSDRLGVASDDLQKLGYAADISGASTMEMQRGLMKLSAGLQNAKTKGTGPFVDNMRRLGISMDDPAIKSGDLVGITKRVADGFANAGPEVNKTAVAMGLLGPKGAALLPMLKKGSAGINEMGQEFEDLGGVIDDETIESFEELERTQKRLKATWGALVSNAVTALIPEVKALTEGILEWVKANKELIKQRLTEIFHALIMVLRALITVAGYVMTAMEFVVEHFQFLVIVLGEAAIAFAVLERASIAAGAKVMWTWIKAAAPFLLLAAVLAFIGLAIDDVMTYMEGGDSLIGRFIDNLEGGWDRLIGGFKAAGQAVLDFLIDTLKTVLKLLALPFTAFWEGWLKVGSFLVSGIKTAFVAVIDWLSDKIEALWEKIKAPARAIQSFFGGGSTGIMGDHGLADAGANFRDIDHAFLAGTQGRDPNTGALIGGDLHINVTAPAGADAAEHGRIINDAIRGNFEAMIRDFHAQSGARTTPGTGSQVSK